MILRDARQTEAEPAAGGKARALATLRRAGFPVPEFFVALPDTDGAEILAAFDALFPDGTPVAVRSSAAGEDGAEHSFAGQFDTFLNVARGDLVARCRAVWASGSGERVQAYREERGAAAGRPAALVQRMLAPDAAGVAFSADPVSGRRAVAVVAAVRGLGEGLVSGERDAETWHVGARAERVSGGEDGGAVLAEADAERVAALARACEAAFGRVQDIEWALAGGTLWLLQSRPVTSLRDLPDPDHPLRIWDNSNIAESYPGVTSPLTYTFARRAYEHVYRRFCVVMSVPEERIAEHGETFAAMIGQVRGRVYYNLVNWYRVLGMLPGFAANRPFMEQMMGVKEPLPAVVVAEIEARGRRGKGRDRMDLARTVAGLVWQAVRLPGTVDRFFRRLREALAREPEGRDEYVWLAHYRELERGLLERWDAPLVNDFFAMIWSGVLRGLCRKWCGDETGDLANRLLANLGPVISAEPARRIRAIAERRARGEAVDAEIAAYLEEFGDRCFEELKLESPTLRDDSGPLWTSVEAMAERFRSGSVPPVPSDVPERAPALGGWRGPMLGWALGQARRCVRDRENLRFERTRVFGRVRKIFRVIGARLAERGVIDAADDVFFLQLEEILGHFESTAAQPITPELVRFRRAEWQRFAAEEPPPDRFETYGAPAAYRKFEDSLAKRGTADGADLKGLGACPGKVRGRVRVVSNPREAGLENGEILVALQTDPGWVVLFPRAAGLLVERGSLLSHSAIVAREMGIPAVVSIPAVTKRLRTGQWVEMDGAAGTVRVLAENEETA
jgi:pyruvate,water dikinase